MQANQLKNVDGVLEGELSQNFLLDKQVIYILFRRTSGLSLLQIDSMRNSEQSFWGIKLRCNHFVYNTYSEQNGVVHIFLRSAPVILQGNEKKT